MSEADHEGTTARAKDSTRRKRRRQQSPPPPQEERPAPALFEAHTTEVSNQDNVVQGAPPSESPSLTEELSKLCLAIADSLATSGGQVLVVNKSAQIQRSLEALQGLITICQQLLSLADCLHEPSGTNEDARALVFRAKLVLCEIQRDGVTEELRTALARLAVVIKATGTPRR